MGIGHINSPGASGYDIAQLKELINSKALGTDITRLEGLINGKASSADITRLETEINDKKSGKRFARFTVGTSTAGWTAEDCDYLCDGTEDNVEIQAAINALPDTGGTVVILDGTYYVTSTIQLNKPNMTLTGQGSAVFHNSLKDKETFNLASANVTLDGVTVYCHNTSFFVGCDKWGRIINNTVYDANYAFMYPSGDEDHATIIANNVIRMSDGYTTKGHTGIMGLSPMIVINNVISGYKRGIYSSGAYHIYAGNSITNCDTGISTDTGNIYANNQIITCGVGIYCNRGDGSIVIGNHIYCNSRFNAGKHTIHITSSCSKITIVNNSWYSGCGILNESTSGDNTIENNYTY